MEESASFTTGPFCLLHFTTWQEVWPWHSLQLPQLDNSPSPQFFLKLPTQPSPWAELATSLPPLLPAQDCFHITCTLSGNLWAPVVSLLGGCRHLQGGSPCRHSQQLRHPEETTLRETSSSSLWVCCFRSWLGKQNQSLWPEKKCRKPKVSVTGFYVELSIIFARASWKYKKSSITMHQKVNGPMHFNSIF